MHASVPVWLDFMKKKKRRASFTLKLLGSGSSGTPHLCLTPSLALSLLFPPLVSAFAVSQHFLFCYLYSPFSLSFSFLVSSRLHLNLSHSCTCHRYLKIGSCMRAICNTTAAISRLHHQPGNVKLETYCLSGQSCTDAIAGDALTYCVKFVMKCCSIIYIFAPFDQEMIGKDAILTFLPVT